eukprot:2187051-Rhodomonas_salina.1
MVPMKSYILDAEDEDASKVNVVYLEELGQLHSRSTTETVCASLENYVSVATFLLEMGGVAMEGAHIVLKEGVERARKSYGCYVAEATSKPKQGLGPLLQNLRMVLVQLMASLNEMYGRFRYKPSFGGRVVVVWSGVEG